MYNIPHGKGERGKIKIRFRHLVEVDEPHSKSYAAYVLLRHDLLIQDVDYEDDYRKRVQFSRNFLESQLKMCGDLVCKYCGKGGLKIEYDYAPVPKNLLATVDHVVPIVKGGKIYDDKNVVVACYKCNNAKGEDDVETFLNKLRIKQNKQQKL